MPAGLGAAQADIAWAEHLVVLFPLWLGDMPALLKGFLGEGRSMIGQRMKPPSRCPPG